MNNDRLKAVAKQINSVVAEHITRKDELSQKITALNAGKNEATEAAAKAFADANVEAYHAAQDAKRAAEDGIHMFQVKLDKLNKTPLLDAAASSKIEQVIREEVTAECRAFWIEIGEMAAQAEGLKGRINEFFTEANHLLYRLQHEIDKDDCMITTATGNKVYIRANEKTATGTGSESLFNVLTTFIDTYEGLKSRGHVIS